MRVSFNQFVGVDGRVKLCGGNKSIDQLQEVECSSGCACASNDTLHNSIERPATTGESRRPVNGEGQSKKKKKSLLLLLPLITRPRLSHQSTTGQVKALLDTRRGVTRRQFAGLKMEFHHRHPHRQQHFAVSISILANLFIKGRL